MNIFRTLLLTIFTCTLSTLAIPFESANFVVGEPEIGDFRLDEEKDLLLLGCADGTLIGKKATIGEVQFSIPAHNSPIYSIDLNSDATLALTCGKDSTIKIWDLAQQSLLKEITLDTIEPQGRFISNDSLVYAPHSGIVKAVYSDVDHTLELGKETRAFALSEDNTLFLMGNNLYNMQTGELVTTGKASFDIQTAGAISPDNKYYAIGNNKSMIKVLDAATGDSIAYMEKIGFVVIYSLAFSRDSKRVFIGSSGGYTALWDFLNGDKGYSTEYDKSFTNLAVSKDGKTYYGLCEDEIHTWETSGDNVTLTVKPSLTTSFSATAVGYTHNGEQVLYKEGDKTYIANPLTGAVEGTIDTTVDSLFVIPESSHILTFKNKEISLVDTIGDTLIFSSPKYDGGKYITTITDFKFSPDGKSAAVVYGRWNTWETKDAGSTLHYIDFQQGKILQSQDLPNNKNLNLSFSNDGSLLALSFGDTTIRQLDVPTLEPISHFTSDKPLSIVDLFWSPDNSKLFLCKNRDTLVWINRATMDVEKSTATSKRSSMKNCYTLKGRKIFVPSSYNKIQVYDFDFNLTGTIETTMSIQDIKCSHDGRLLSVLTQNKLSFYDTKTLEERVSYPVSHSTHVSCFFNPSKDQVLIGNRTYTGVFDVSEYVPILKPSNSTQKNHITFSNKSLTLNLKDENSQAISLHLYSPLGKLVDKRIINATEKSIQMNQDLATGIYFYSILMGSQIVQQGRVHIR